MKNLLIVAIVLFSSVSPALARRSSNGQGNVVHTRRAPVVMHRAVPGGGGVHVYGGGR